jgi:hypothetical protein
MRNLSNVISISQVIILERRSVAYTTDGKIDALFGIVEFFTYRNAQITVPVNDYIAIR